MSISSRLVRVFFAAAALVGAAVAPAGCSAFGDGEGGDGDGGGSSMVIDGPVGMGELLQVCEDDASLSQAPAYAGPGPHPLMLFEPARGNNPERTSLGPRLFDRPPPELDPALTAPFENVQLVACVERTGTNPTDVVCRFDLGGDVPFLRAAYRVVVREARTGTVVATREIGAGAEGCPSSVTVDLLDATVYSLPKPWQYYEAMRPMLLWDGQGTSPTSQPAAGAAVPRGEPLVEGSVTLHPPTGLDPTSAAVVDVYRRYWVAYTALTATGGGDVRGALSQVASREHGYSVHEYLARSLSGASRTESGPVVLTPVVNPAPDGVGYVVADCVDTTGRLVYLDGRATGETGVRYPESLLIADQGSGFVVTGFAPAVPATCAT